MVQEGSAFKDMVFTEGSAQAQAQDQDQDQTKTKTKPEPEIDIETLSATRHGGVGPAA